MISDPLDRPRPDGDCSAYYACLLGTALGDSIGLPREGLSSRKAWRIFGAPPLEHAFWFGWGAVSDDTEHACLTAQALIASAGEPQRFAHELAKRLRWWLLGLPAGIGLATMRSILKLWLGFSPHKSGVWSAGNGPAMRAAILGVYAGDNLQRLAELVRISTRITHTDPRAEQGAMIVAVAAAYSLARPRGDFAARGFLQFVKPFVRDEQLLANLTSACQFAAHGKSAEEFSDSLGLARGVSGFINHTVPVAIFCWLRHRDDFRAAVEAAVCLGGDTDTVGAIVGGLVYARTLPETGALTPPATWLSGLRISEQRSGCERMDEAKFNSPRPRVGAMNGSHWLARLSQQLAQVKQTGQPRQPATRPFFFVLIRNLAFLAIVLLHGFRRLLPPY